PKKEPAAEPPEEEKPKVGLKVVGKIDLDGAGKKKPAPEAKEEPEAKPAEPEEKPPAPEPSEPEAPEAPAAEEAPAETEEPAPASDETPPDEQAAEQPEPEKKDDVIRAEAPQLRGVKVLGKIDISETEKEKKKKKKEKEKAKEKKGTEGKEEDSSSGRRKRIRTRRKVRASATDGQGGSARARRGRDEVKEVSQKEIDEKIKATMARLSGGGKKKRQRLRRESRERQREKQEQRELALESGKLQVTEFITVQELANLMDVDVTEVITACLNLGVIVSINQRLDAELIELVAEEFGHEVEFIEAEEELEEEEEIVDDPADLVPRAPIVTVMGHVDHGKTSLLDYIRKTNVAAGEAGGITQHIGAYEVEVGEERRKITFLDTPGHEAFTAMRARGAKVTDVAVIIIAANDSVMPQTREAISHAQAAGVPMVFAINKIDVPGAQPEKIKQELANMNILVEDWGGEYQCQEISAKTGQGIPELLEKILLVADLLELKANPKRKAIGAILEASLDKGRGYVAKALVQNGTLRIGDPMVAGEHAGKVKAMFNERGQRIKEAGPSTPVLVLGLSGAPQAGDRFKVMDSESEARQLASKRAQIAREQATRATKRISLDEIGRRLALGTFKELNLIVKGDVDGSVEALSDALIKLSLETVQVNVIHKAVGQIVESDVLLASASDAIIIGFQVRPSLGARKLAEREGVQIKLYSIIYEAIDEIKAAIEGMLEPTKEERIVCNLEVREVFKISKVGTVAGCYVQDGKITRNTHVRVIRDGIVIYPTKEGVVGEIASLKRFKEDVKEVKAGLECGVGIKNFNDIKVGDIIEGYEIVEVKQKIT
ncbi:MAG: translation initiation factor IF-2, partial [Bacteroidetes bacterium]